MANSNEKTCFGEWVDVADGVFNFAKINKLATYLFSDKFHIVKSNNKKELKCQI